MVELAKLQDLHTGQLAGSWTLDQGAEWSSELSTVYELEGGDGQHPTAGELTSSFPEPSEPLDQEQLAELRLARKSLISASALVWPPLLRNPGCP